MSNDGWSTTTEQPQASSFNYSDTTKQILSYFQNDRDKLIAAWRDTEKEFRRVQENERMLRTAVFEVQFPNPKAGTNRFELGNGYSLKAVWPMNYKASETATENALDEMAKIGPTFQVIADRLVKWKPEVSIKEYKALCEDKSPGALQARKLFDAVLTITPGMPQLEIEEPKAGK